MYTLADLYFNEYCEFVDGKSLLQSVSLLERDMVNTRPTFLVRIVRVETSSIPLFFGSMTISCK